jgi:hypothetical protein
MPSQFMIFLAAILPLLSAIPDYATFEVVAEKILFILDLKATIMFLEPNSCTSVELFIKTVAAIADNKTADLKNIHVVETLLNKECPGWQVSNPEFLEFVYNTVSRMRCCGNVEFFVCIMELILKYQDIDLLDEGFAF